MSIPGKAVGWADSALSVLIRKMRERPMGF